MSILHNLVDMVCLPPSRSTVSRRRSLHDSFWTFAPPTTTTAPLTRQYQVFIFPYTLEGISLLLSGQILHGSLDRTMTLEATSKTWMEIFAQIQHRDSPFGSQAEARQLSPRDLLHRHSTTHLLLASLARSPIPLYFDLVSTPYLADAILVV